MGETVRSRASDRVSTFAAALLVAAWVALFGVDRLSAQSPTHPLAPLSASEYSAVTELLRDEQYTDDESFYPLMTLQEPAKDDVLRWTPGDPVPRRVFVIVKKALQTFEAVVDVGAGELISWTEVPDVEPGVLLSEEWYLAQQIVLAHPEWRAALRRRGFENSTEVVCIPLTAGYFGTVEEEGRRLVKVVCYDTRGIENFWGRPIEGLIAVVDHDQGEVVEIIDTGILPIPTAPVDFDQGSVGMLREGPNPIATVQPLGPSFEVDGDQVSWQQWQFHVRIDPRLGLVVSLVRYDDQERPRSILYQGALSELFVPYMDPDVGWYFRTYLDAGEYGVGKLAAQLEPGMDCPASAEFFDAVFADDWGGPYTQERAACVFERDPGEVAWRHYEAVSGQTQVRKRTELVLRLVATVGNYDYVFDWVFRQDGAIRVAVGASGVEQVKAVASRTIADDTDGRDRAYGRMVAEHTVAVNHDHFFSFRLDLDIDGPQNSFLLDRLRPQRLEGQGPRRSIWVVDSQMAVREQDAQLRIEIERPALWRVINPNVLGPLGYPVSYELRPRANAVSLLSPEDFPQRRAGFTDFHLWVTPFDARERYAAGTYPNQSKGGDGLPRWTSDNRAIQNTDLVLWYTLGMHHVVRAEDWPVLPTSWMEFELRPFDFFERNPALDLPW